MFSERIKELRIQNQIPQRQIAAALDIDTATYCKIEKGERKAKKEQITILSKMLHVNAEHLLTSNPQLSSSASFLRLNVLSSLN